MYFCNQTCSSILPVEEAIFGRIDDIGDMFKREVHMEFITNCLMKSDAHLFADYSYIHILVAHGPPERRNETHQPCWKDLLNPEQCELMKRNHGFVVGYMLMATESPKDVHLIECIDTRVPGYNIAEAMIHKYENEVATITSSNESFTPVKLLPKCVLPKEITRHAAKYWKRFFEKRYGVQHSEALRQVKTNSNLEQYVLWDALDALLQ
jgi:hypothetical protein